jgi:hypothetical protein
MNRLEEWVVAMGLDAAVVGEGGGFCSCMPIRMNSLILLEEACPFALRCGAALG